MENSGKAWIGGAFLGLALVGLFVMLCGIGLSLGFRTLSVISFFSVIVLLALISVIKRVTGSKSEDRQ